MKIEKRWREGVVCKKIDIQFLCQHCNRRFDLWTTPVCKCCNMENMPPLIHTLHLEWPTMGRYFWGKRKSEKSAVIGNWIQGSWLVQPVSYTKQTTTSPHNPLYIESLATGLFCHFTKPPAQGSLSFVVRLPGECAFLLLEMEELSTRLHMDLFLGACLEWRFHFPIISLPAAAFFHIRPILYWSGW